MLIDINEKIFKVQVKTATKQWNGYTLNSARRHVSGVKNYSRKDFDFMVSKIKDDWYVFDHRIEIKSTITVFDSGSGKYSYAKNNWEVFNL